MSAKGSSHSALDRRAFLGRLGGATALTLGAGAAGVPRLSEAKEPGGANQRRVQAFQVRSDAATYHLHVTPPAHPVNGDEARYRNRIGSFSKGLPHNAFGEVNPRAYDSLLRACMTGNPADFEAIIIGGSEPLVDPQAGLAFSLEGADSHELAMPPAPALASAQRAGEAVECYWMALLRDVNFTDYDSHPLARDAAEELSRLTDFRGPKIGSQVTPRTLFRGFTRGDVIGPYISQFLFWTTDFGAAQVVQQFETVLPIGAGGADYMTDVPSWLAVQNGQGPFAEDRFDPVRRYIRNGRDIGQYVHVDVLFEAYFNACLVLLDVMGAPLNPGNPYVRSSNQTGFGTFGGPHLKAVLASASVEALKAVWYQKWFVHRCLRPEAFGGLVHFTRTGARGYPLHTDIVNSQAVHEVFHRYATSLLPHAFPGGCPQHPSYGAGHATVAGACATIVKAFFDESFTIPDPVESTPNGLALVPYTGSDAGQMTLGGEMNKLAANIAIGRNHAGVHWRSDCEESLRLGEAVAINLLRDQRSCYNEDFGGFTFTRFDGTKVTV